MTLPSQAHTAARTRMRLPARQAAFQEAGAEERQRRALPLIAGTASTARLSGSSS